MTYKQILHAVFGFFFTTGSSSLLAAGCTQTGLYTAENLHINALEARSAGSYNLQGSTATSLPAHCRIAAVLTPSDDSHIEMELWLPEKWNGKFLAVGNGGWAGSISYSAMASGLRAGYAVASNDTGHQGGSAEFAVGHPEQVTDFAYRAMHEMAVHAKALVQSYYGTAAQLSYFEGCSTGGRQGMIAAQRYPADFDAIIAGAPVYNQLALNGSQLHNMQTVLLDQTRYLPPENIQLLHAAVLAACETHDGVNDGFLNNPQACNFDPDSLACTTADSSACLTPQQLMSVHAVYEGTRSSSGELLYPGHAPGFELGWRMLTTGSTPPTLQSDAFAFVAHEDPAWQWQDFVLETDLALARDKAGAIEALDPDLTEFRARGGKLLFYHGWNDPGPSPFNTIAYYNAVLQTGGGPQDDWMRLFMMPGMGHCRGGIGPDQADFLGALERWREDGIAPERITSARISEGSVDMTRPLCAYPAAAQWNGQGNPDDAASYTCR